MNEKKYELLTDDTIIVNGITLYRIKALKDFGNVKKGDIGGYIEKESNLSHEGNCWVYGNAVIGGNANVYENAKISGDANVYENAKISGDANVYDDAEVCGNANVYNDARVFGNAYVFGDAVIGGNANVYNDARVFGNAYVFGDAKVFGTCLVYDEAKVSDEASVFGNAVIHGDKNISHNAFILSNNDYLYIGSIGSRNDTTTFFKTKDGLIYVNCGCFSGTLEEFEKKVEEVHKDNKYGKEYKLAIDMAKTHMLSN